MAIELSDRQRHGRWALNRKYQGDGRWGHDSGSNDLRGWSVTKHRPTSLAWAKGSGGKAGRRGVIVHAIRYVLQASSKGEEDQWLTVWQCGGQAWSKPLLIQKPDEVCRRCLIKSENQPSTVMLTKEVNP